MSEPSDTIDIAGLEDEPGKLYVIGIDPNHSQRAAERFADRFSGVFEHAEFAVVSGNLSVEGEVRFYELTKDEMKTIAEAAEEMGVTEDDG